MLCKWCLILSQFQLKIYFDSIYLVYIRAKYPAYLIVSDLITLPTFEE
jgi:hypothetical protein